MNEGSSLIEYRCYFPKTLCHLLSGQDDSNVKFIQSNTGVKIFLNECPHSTDFNVCMIKGKQEQIDNALIMISSDERFGKVDLSPVNIFKERPVSPGTDDRPGPSGISSLLQSEAIEESSPLKTGLLSSIDAVFEQNRLEDERRIEKFKRKREAELEHSRYLKNTSSHSMMAEAKFVINQWANIHSGRKMTAMTKEAADRRRHRSPYSRPVSREASPSKVTKQTSRFGTSLYTNGQRRSSNSPLSVVTSPSVDSIEEDMLTDVKVSKPAARNQSIIELSDDEDNIINLSDCCIMDHSDFLSCDARSSTIDLVERNLLGERPSSSTQEENACVKCPILNCNLNFTNKTDFEAHMDQFKHSPINPWVEFPSKDAGEAFMCPECVKVFQDISACNQHINDKKHSRTCSPLPVIGYLCGQCLGVFSTQEICTLHIKELKHQQPSFPFADDLNKTYTSGIPISRKFFNHYYTRCIESEYQIVCCECELPISSARELQQHYDETKLTHHCMSVTKITRTDIFAAYFCTHICGTCGAAVSNPKQNGGFHVCSKTVAGKIMVDGCSSFSSLILGLCIKHEQSDSQDLRTQVKVENNNRPVSLRTTSTVLSSSDDLTDPSYLKTMVNIIFLDMDNWGGFFQKLPNRLPKQTFVWGFYGGKTQWNEPVCCGPYVYQKSERRFHLHERCGTTKDAADFAICLTVGKMDMCLPSTVHFTILSGDKGFCEIERQMKTSKRKAVVINPHEAIKMSSQMLYMLIVSVGDN